MSRKRIYNISDFSGGITDQIRNTNDLSRCAHVSHFDIYRDPNKMYPMPGYIDDMNDGSTATGMKSYGIKAFCFVDGFLFAVGTTSGGTGTKIVAKDAPTDAAWDLTPLSATIEGTYTLFAGTFLTGLSSSYLYFVTTDSGKTWLTRANGSTVTDNFEELISSALSGSTRLVGELGVDSYIYTNKGTQNILRVNGSTVTDDVKTTGFVPRDLQNGDLQLGIFGNTSTPYYAKLLLWDYSSLLVDQPISFGRGVGRVIGYVNGMWVGVVDENLTTDIAAFAEEENGLHSFAVKYATSGGSQTITRVYGATNTGGKIAPTRCYYRDAMLFEARVPQDATPTSYKGGIWAIGPTPRGGLALSQLLDTESLGTIEAYHSFGSHHFFAHAGDGSISRLDDFVTGTYDVAAIYESLVFGANTPNYKKLNGISVHTENLPASGSVVMKYRTDTDSSWTTLGTSSTTGTQIHNFTSVAGVPIGNFTEIQFRLEVTGNAPVKNIHVSLEELDTTPYDS